MGRFKKVDSSSENTPATVLRGVSIHTLHFVVQPIGNDFIVACGIHLPLEVGQVVLLRDRLGEGVKARSERLIPIVSGGFGRPAHLVIAAEDVVVHDGLHRFRHCRGIVILLWEDVAQD